MKKIRKIINNPGVFTIYECSGENAGCIAIYPDEIKKMEEIRNAYIDDTIPDNYTIKVYKFGKCGTKDPETEIWDILDNEPVECKVKDIISSDIGYKYCY